MQVIEHYNTVFDSLHANSQVDTVTTGFNRMPFSTIWGFILLHIPEVRKYGVNVDLDFNAVFKKGVMDKSYTAHMLLAYYRMSLYSRMLVSEDQSKLEYTEIDFMYHTNLLWYNKFKDALNTFDGEKVSHKWLN